MPLGLWKSKWEIHREEMARRDAEWREWRTKSDEQWAEWRKEADRRDAESSAYWAKSDEQWAEWRAARAEADAEWRERHDELMARIDENQRETMAAFKIVIEELRGLRREVNDLKDAVNANTEAILKLIDRFDEWEGRPPGSGRMGPRSA
jgi:chromosome segregation ATPase